MISFLEQYRYLLLALVLTVGSVFLYLFGSQAYDSNGQLGFPLDDPWIHLQFAKNLHDYGYFSYFKNEMVTAGSTSPLYTAILSIGFFITSNEMLLSYALGVVFLLLAAFFIFKIMVIQRSPDQFSGMVVPSLGASLLLLLEPRMQWAAFSGMETSLFILMLLAASCFYLAKDAVPFGIASGLLIWTRPEALVFYLAVALDLLYRSKWVVVPKARKKPQQTQASSKAWLKISFWIACVLTAAYFAFNVFLSGSIFPNTYAAKLKYYSSSMTPGFPSQVFQFLAEGHMVIPAVLAGIGILAIVVKLFKREPQPYLLFLLISIGLFLAYWLKLPFLYQEGRYMMPVLPFVILLAASGLHELIAGGKKVIRSVNRVAGIGIQVAVILTVGTQFIFGSWSKREGFAETCKYISDRQVRTAHWLRENTPENAIIGTHDIGAIAYYSGRRIADMVGLVSPDMIERIGSLTRLHQFLVDKNVTHVATLRNWFEIVNQQPLFVTNERAPEIMEVFAFDPQRTHLTSQDVTRATETAVQYISRGQSHVALQVLQEAIARDPGNSRVRNLLGTAFMMAGRWDDAKHELDAALRLHPDLLAAKVGLARVAAAQNRPHDAVAQLESIANHHPEYPPVYQALADVYGTFKLDSVKANLYLQRFGTLMNKQH